MTKRVAEVLNETLQAAGEERCYGIVGDTLNRSLMGIDRSAIDWVHMRHEEAGALRRNMRQRRHGKGSDVWEMLVENIPDPFR